MEQHTESGSERPPSKKDPAALSMEEIVKTCYDRLPQKHLEREKVISRVITFVNETPSILTYDLVFGKKIIKVLRHIRTRSPQHFDPIATRAYGYCLEELGRLDHLLKVTGFIRRKLVPDREERNSLRTMQAHIEYDAGQCSDFLFRRKQSLDYGKAAFDHYTKAVTALQENNDLLDRFPIHEAIVELARRMVDMTHEVKYASAGYQHCRAALELFEASKEKTKKKGRLCSTAGYFAEYCDWELQKKQEGYTPYWLTLARQSWKEAAEAHEEEGDFLKAWRDYNAAARIERKLYQTTNEISFYYDSLQHRMRAVGVTTKDNPLKAALMFTSIGDESIEKFNEDHDNAFGRLAFEAYRHAFWLFDTGKIPARYQDVYETVVNNVFLLMGMYHFEILEMAVKDPQ